MTEKYADEIAVRMVESRDRLIKDAITHVLGEFWTTADITGRCSIIILQDKTEIFTLDDMHLIHFYHLRSEVDSSGIGFEYKCFQQYRLLY